jgi:ATP-dependent helicase/nuclease subunit A
MTRAKDRLILLDFNRKETAAKKKSAEAKKETRIEDCKTYGDMVVTAMEKSEEARKAMRVMEISQLVDEKEAEVAPAPAAETAPFHESSMPDSTTESGLSAEEKKVVEEIKGRIDFQYPHIAAKDIKAKYSVTELVSGDYKPAEKIFTGEDPEDETVMDEAMRRGSLMHLAFRQLLAGLKKKPDEDIGAFLLRLVDANLITEDDLPLIDIGQINLFIESPLFARMKKAEDIRFEEAFNMLYRDENLAEEVIVQGKIDCFFFEGDEIILVDYKATRSGLEKNKKQLDLYAMALEEAYVKKVRERLIYVMGEGECVNFCEPNERSSGQ